MWLECCSPWGFFKDIDTYTSSLIYTEDPSKRMTIFAIFGSIEKKGALELGTHWKGGLLFSFTLFTVWFVRTSLVVQWLRLCTSTAEGAGSILCGETRIPHGRRHSQKKKKFVPPRTISLQYIIMLGTSLVVQWLRLCTPSAGGPGSIPGRRFVPLQALSMAYIAGKASSKNSLGVPQKVKQELICDPAISSHNNLFANVYTGTILNG